MTILENGGKTLELLFDSICIRIYDPADKVGKLLLIKIEKLLLIKKGTLTWKI